MHVKTFIQASKANTKTRRIKEKQESEFREEKINQNRV